MKLIECIKVFKILFPLGIVFLALIPIGFYWNDITLVVVGIIISLIFYGAIFEVAILWWWDERKKIVVR